MKKITIPLSGITRSTDDGISKDGECIELINVRVKNGSLSPMGRPIQGKIFPGGRKPVYIHQNAGYTHYLSYSESAGILYHEYNKVGGEYVPVGASICEVPDLINVESIGNTLIVLTPTGIKYLIFLEGTYKNLGQKPPLPTLAFKKGHQISKSEELGGPFNLEWNMSAGNDTAERHQTFRDACTGALFKTMDSLKEEGYIYEHVTIRYAIRLFDGSLIRHSSPTVLTLDSSNSPFIMLKGSGTGTTVRPDERVDIKNVTGRAQLTGFLIDYTVTEIGEIQTWGDIIQSIDIFINLQNPFEDTAALDLRAPKPNTKYEFGKKTDINKFFGKTSNFYFIESIPIKELKVGKGAEVREEQSGRATIQIVGIDLKDKLKNLVQQEAMDDDDFSHTSIYGLCSFVYNSRLHLGNIRTQLFEGYKYSQLANYDNPDSNENVLSATIYTYLQSEKGLSIVKSTNSNINSFGLSPIITYPDSRAYRMEIKVTTPVGEKGISLNLKPHPFLSCAYYQDKDMAPIQLNTSTIIQDVSTENTTDISPNKLKVSELNNPLVFPVEQTYLVSNGEIIGLCSATTALSQGQFGQFPLYVFTNEGLYTLSIGTGSIAYAASHPVSRDVCTNKESIRSIDSAIVFATEAGLMLLSGSSIQKISTKIEGYLPPCINSSPVIGKILDIPQFGKVVSSTDFKDYISAASIGYNYEEKEIVVANKNLPYCYVYSLSSGEWTKISERFDGFLNSYPNTLALVSKGGNYSLYNIHNPHRTINDIAIITRPAKMGSLTHKRILQSALRGIVHPSLSDLYLRGEPVQFRGENVNIFSQAGFYVLGSNDAEHFTLLAGTEKLNDIRDLITKMNKTKACKYFMFCLVGGVRTDVALNYIEVMADETYQNRLR